MTHNITFDLTKQTAKPTNAGAVSNNIKTVKSVTIEEFSKMVTQPFGYSFTPGVFNGTRSNDTWKETSLFCLDFDSGLTPEEGIEIFKTLGINPNVVYTSFSDTPELRKTRFCFFLDQVIDDINMFKFIQTNLMRVIDDKAKASDKSCRDAARLFYGGLQVVHLDSTENNAATLNSILNTVQISSDKMQTRGIATFAEKRVSSYIYKDNTHIPAKLDGEYNDGKLLEKFDFDLAKEEVLIFNDFLTGGWLTHGQIFGIATNLVHIKGGMKLMKDTMLAANAAGTARYTNNNFAILPYVNNKKYTPQRLENFSPYDEDAQHLNIISSVRTVKGQITNMKEAQEDVLSLKEAELLFGEEFKKALEAEEGVFLFKVPTGLGKTAALELVKNATLAFPTHSLKQEVSNRMKVEHACTPELPMFNEDLRKRIEFLYNVGLTSKASSLLQEVAKDKSGSYDTIDIELAKEYIKMNRETYSSNDTVLTTHERAMFGEFKHDTLIFDEDPIQSFMTIKTVAIGDLITLEAFDNTKNEVKAIIDYLRHQLPSAQIIDTPMMAINYDAMVDNILDTNINSNFIDFLDSSQIVKDANDANLIHFVVKRPLPKVKKLIIMSATASEFIYRKLYPNLQVVDITDVQQVGQVIQNTNRSYSRESLRTSLTPIVKEVGTLPVITFASMKDKFDNPVKDMHFGNVSGYDTLKGQDIAVVGTPHLPNFVYFLYAKALDIKLTNRDNITKNIDVEYNGFKFKFNTFENEDLRNIQLSLIESQIIQCVGRSRSLREEATVHLYSNLPLRQTTTFINKKLK